MAEHYKIQCEYESLEALKSILSNLPGVVIYFYPQLDIQKDYIAHQCTFFFRDALRNKTPLHYLCL